MRSTANALRPSHARGCALAPLAGDAAAWTHAGATRACKKAPIVAKQPTQKHLSNLTARTSGKVMVRAPKSAAAFSRGLNLRKHVALPLELGRLLFRGL